MSAEQLDTFENQSKKMLEDLEKKSGKLDPNLLEVTWYKWDISMRIDMEIFVWGCASSWQAQRRLRKSAREQNDDDEVADEQPKATKPKSKAKAKARGKAKGRGKAKSEGERKERPLEETDRGDDLLLDLLELEAESDCEKHLRRQEDGVKRKLTFSDVEGNAMDLAGEDDKKAGEPLLNLDRSLMMIMCTYIVLCSRDT